jgi:hypothetical protein
MTGNSHANAEEQFVEQRFEFLDLARQRYPDAPTSLDELMACPPRPLQPIMVDNTGVLSEEETTQVQIAFETGFGVVSVVPWSAQPPPRGERHPLLIFAERLGLKSEIGVPVDHPMEGHPEAVSRFGPPDGTLKIYNLPVQPGGPRYREQAETNEMFHAHNDGLGYAGLVRTAILMVDHPPINGGYTFFQNLVRVSTSLAASDPKAFRALFLPDAIRATRPRGKGAIRVESPVLFLGREGRPQCFFRVTTGEYRIEWRDDADLNRARTVLERLCAPFGPDSRFIHMTQIGETVVIANQQVAHGRTPFVEHPDGVGRVLARKWFVAKKEDATYRHVPGMVIDPRWANLFPDRFTGDATVGEWHFDHGRGENIRIG